MGADGRLRIDNRFFRIDASGKISGSDLARLICELCRVLRDGNGVQIDDTKNAVFFMLQRRKFLQRAEIISKMERAGRLHAGKDAIRAGIAIRHELSFRSVTRKRPAYICEVIGPQEGCGDKVQKPARTADKNEPDEIH